MSARDTHAALARAFRDVTLNLIGLLNVYEADPDLIDAAAEVLGRVFHAHLSRSTPNGAPPDSGTALRDLANEMDTAAEQAA
jgi:hypothetical protein